MKDNLTSEESLKIIEEMIEQSKEKFRSKDSVFFLFWGYLGILNILLFLVMDHFVGTPLAHYVWLLFLTGFIFNFVQGRKFSAEASVITKIDKFISQMWIGISLGSGVLFLASPILTWLMMPIMMIVIGIGIFSHGSIINFKPFKWGAIIAFIAALACFYLQDPFYAMLIFALNSFVSFVIPGHLLRNQKAINV